MGYLDCSRRLSRLAQQQRLKGVTGVDVVIENLHDDAAMCGVTKAGLTTAASKALLDNGVRVASETSPTTLYVNINTLVL